jgi:hypothetical protein
MTFCRLEYTKRLLRRCPFLELQYIYIYIQVVNSSKISVTTCSSPWDKNSHNHHCTNFISNLLKILKPTAKPKTSLYNAILKQLTVVEFGNESCKNRKNKSDRLLLHGGLLQLNALSEQDHTNHGSLN